MARHPMPDVIVLLPGILGSVLKKNGKTVWGFTAGTLGSALISRGASMRKDLWIEEDDPDLDDLGDGVVADSLMSDLHLIPGLWKIDGYSKVARVIEERFQVAHGENFFTFPYDWRRDNRVSARALARRTHDWLARWRARGNPDAKLILVAHSMGGLVSRWFLEVMEGWRDTRALITFGTPYRGSMNALDTLVHGIRKGPFGLIDLTEFGRRLTSIYQLLPTYPVYDPGTGDGTLLRLAETTGIPHLDLVRARAAREDFHEEIRRAVEVNGNDPRYEEMGNWVHPIVGIGQETVQSARRKGNGLDLLKSHGGTNHSGDGTVPRVSAVPHEYGNRRMETFSSTKHGGLQNADPVLVQLDGLLQSLYFDLGDFLTPGAPAARIALEAEDLLFSGEPVDVRAKMEGWSGDLSAELIDAAGDLVIARSPMAGDPDGWRTARFDPPRPGNYRIRVSAGAGVEPVTDAFTVAEGEMDRWIAEGVLTAEVVLPVSGDTTPPTGVPRAIAEDPDEPWVVAEGCGG